MKTYWIVRENGRIVAALAETYEINDPHQFIEDIMEFAEIGPVERIRTEEPIHLGGTVGKFVRPKKAPGARRREGWKSSKEYQ